MDIFTGYGFFPIDKVQYTNDIHSILRFKMFKNIFGRLVYNYTVFAKVYSSIHEVGILAPKNLKLNLSVQCTVQ